MKPFLYQVAALCYARYGMEVSRLAFVFPNRRTGLFFQKYLAEVAGRPLFSPAILTINDLFARLAKRQTADRISLLFLLYAHYVRLSGTDESFDDFLYWGELLLNDFDDIDKYMVDARQLFRNLSDLKEIEQGLDYLSEEQIAAIRTFWSSFNRRGNAPNHQHFLALWQILFALYTDFRAALAAVGKAYEGQLFREVAEQDGAYELPYEQIVFVGLNALSVAEERFLDRLQQQGVADFYWDTYSDKVCDPDNRASFFIMRNAERYPSRFPMPTESHPEAQIEVIGVPSGIGQAKQLHTLLQTWFPTNEVSADEALRTAVVLPEESLLVPVLHAIPSTIAHINVTMGYPLAGTPIASLVEAVMALQQQVRWVDSQPLFYYAQVLPLLNHRYLFSTDSEVVSTLIKEITETNRVYLEPDFLARTPFLKQLFQPVVQVADFADYLIRFLEALNERLTARPDDPDEASAERGQLAKEIEQEFIFHYFATVNRMREEMREHEVAMRLDTFFRLLKRMADRVTIPFQGEPLSGLQIMGVLETRALDFDRLVILSMNEGVFPQHKPANTFIPYHLRQGFGLPTYEHQDSIWAYHFYRLMERAKQVCLVYDTRSTGLCSGEVSRFVHQLRYHYALPLQDKLVVYQVASQPPSQWVIPKDAAVMRQLSAFRRGGGKAISASAINRFLHCPLSFYWTYLEGIREEDAVTETVESDIFGSILHKVMECLYHPFEGKRVTDDLLRHLKKEGTLLHAAVTQAFASELFKTDTVKELRGQNFLNGEIIRKYAERILEQDRHLTPFTYLESEKRIEGCLTLTDGSQVNLKGFIDRVDEVKGAVRIIDYKTGNPKPQFTSVEQLFDPEAKSRPKEVMQVFFYCWMYERWADRPETTPLQPGIYAVRNLFKEAFDTSISYKPDKQSQPEQVGDFCRFSSSFEEALRLCLDRLFDPTIPFTQAAHTEGCSYCLFKTLCGR